MVAKIASGEIEDRRDKSKDPAAMALGRRGGLKGRQSSPVTVPQPARYAVHKLIVAQLRRQESAKREKDLIQAKELIAALDAGYPGAVKDALTNARQRGRKWKAAVDRSLREIGLDL